MTDQVLILGGRGRVGSSVAQDIVSHTRSQIIITSRNITAGEAVSAQLGDRVQFLELDLADVDNLKNAIASSNLVIHCAGPFHHRDAEVLQLCIEQGVNYIDVSDHRSFTRKALALRTSAENAGVTAIINTGIFPGISNSMVRQCAEQLDEPERIHLSYLVAGSGGAGITVMRTTFLGLQHPFEMLIDGKWQEIKPYSDREVIQFPPPYGKAGVYWFDMPEAVTLPETFPVKTVITKFGSVPDFYNHLTWIAAHLFPKKLLQQPRAVEFLSRVSHLMTDVTNPFSGIGVAVRAEVTGRKGGENAGYCATVLHNNAAIATGLGAGAIAQLLLAKELIKPGVWAQEQALPTDLFEQTLASRGLTIRQEQLK